MADDAQEGKPRGRTTGSSSAARLDSAEKRLLFRVRVAASVVIVGLLVAYVLTPAVIHDFHTSDVIVASLLGGLLLMLGVEGVIRLPGIGGDK